MKMAQSTSSVAVSFRIINQWVGGAIYKRVFLEVIVYILLH